MKTRIARLLLCCLLLLMLTGCWDYRGLDDINIVSGIAVDRIEETGELELTMELVNISSSEDSRTVDSLYITGIGKTIFDAVRNAKKKLYNQLYFGGTRMLIISSQIAKEEGILYIIDGLLRDGEPRESIIVAVSKEESAKALILTPGLDVRDVSFEMARIVELNERGDTTSSKVALYQAYNMLKSEAHQLLLPAFHLTENDGKEVVEVEGMALFRDGKLVDYTSPEETKYLLLMTTTPKGASITFPTDASGENMLSLEVQRCKNKTDFKYVDGRLFIVVDVKLDLGILELYDAGIKPDVEGLLQLRGQTEAYIKAQMESLFASVQQDPGFDIFGYGQRVYEGHNALWEQIGSEWDAVFSQAVLTANVLVEFVNTGFLVE